MASSQDFQNSKLSVNPALTASVASVPYLKGDIASALASEIGNKVTMVNPDVFIERMFTVDAGVAQKISEHRQVIDAFKRIPKPGSGLEKTFYLPFTELASVIQARYKPDLKSEHKALKSREMRTLSKEDKDRLTKLDQEVRRLDRLPTDQADLRWTAIPDKSPTSGEKTTPLVRPDAGCLRARKTAKDPTLTGFSWEDIVTPIEVKPYANSSSTRDATRQLQSYIRMVLRHQHDRLFIFGIILCGHQMQIGYCDRSSVIFTDAFDIMQDKSKAVKILAALSILDRRALGFDNTMKLVITERGNDTSHPTLQHLYSTHDLAVKHMNTHSGIDPYLVRWSIFVPGQEQTEADRKGSWYITTKAISLTKAEVMVGRATMVWRVRELDANLKEIVSERTLVLKSAWQDDENRTEAELYNLGAQGGSMKNVGKVQRSVKLSKCWLPNTDLNDPSALEYTTEQVRKGLSASDLRTVVWNDGVQAVPSTAPKSLRDNPERSGDQSLPRSNPGYDRWISTHQSKSPDLQNRTLTRTLMETYGWSLKEFKDLIELVTVIRDAVKGHQNMYHAGILHRDLSTGNAVICPDKKSKSVEEAAVTVIGALIDLDHAQRQTSWLSCAPISAEDEFAEPAPTANHLRSKTAREIADLLADNSFPEQVQANDKAVREDPTVQRKRDVDDPLEEELKVSVIKFLKSLDTPLLEKILKRFRYSRSNDAVAAHFLALVIKAYHHEGYPRMLEEITKRVDYPKEEHYVAWDSAKGSVPDFKSMSDTSRTGTYAFMSYEVKRPNVYYVAEPLVVPRSPRVHNAIHDIESFFWVFLQQCLTADGPGGHRRRELLFKVDKSKVASAVDKQDSDRILILQSHVRDLFEDPVVVNLPDYKKKVFDKPQLLDEALGCVHPYFERVVTTLRKWWELVRISHEMPDRYTMGTIHFQILDLLEETLKMLKTTDKGEVESAMDQLREEDILQWRIEDLKAYFPFKASVPEKEKVEEKGKERA
ncbi:hypothetical protein EIP91_000540 [Steccherinum ochraceum]|uniref:Fungal-type protein kinase domain-containing protein n=1 Tax=Steccherinum ochraceum TaxID=92696 RepID=A0A4R0RQK1_9APHY|nr:hypothetical protein EIP91_000540 [Steccherinum ochraceum]